MLPPPVHLVTDRRLVSDLAGAVRLAVRQAAPGQVAVHLREKDLGGAALLGTARALAALCHQAGQLLLVNDRIDVALAAGADGVHLPSRGVPPADARRLLGPGRLVGISCHAIEDVRAALAGGADYATFGPVFDTPSKRRYGAPVGLDALRGAAALGLPLIALGGVDVARAAQVVEAGASGVAAIRAWLEAPDPGRPVAAFIEAATRP
jgi:thiamine-phosphate pyrophosphorylase